MRLKIARLKRLTGLETKTSQHWLCGSVRLKRPADSEILRWLPLSIESCHVLHLMTWYHQDDICNVQHSHQLLQKSLSKMWYLKNPLLSVIIVLFSQIFEHYPASLFPNVPQESQWSLCCDEIRLYVMASIKVKLQWKWASLWRRGRGLVQVRGDELNSRFSIIFRETGEGAVSIWKTKLYLIISIRFMFP